MEMMTQLLPPTTAIGSSPATKPKQAKQDDGTAAEVVSFPTMLQENTRTLGIGSSTTPSAEVAEGNGQSLVVSDVAFVEMEVAGVLPQELASAENATIQPEVIQISSEEIAPATKIASVVKTPVPAPAPAQLETVPLPTPNETSILVPPTSVTSNENPSNIQQFAKSPVPSQIKIDSSEPVSLVEKTMHSLSQTKETSDQAASSGALIEEHQPVMKLESNTKNQVIKPDDPRIETIKAEVVLESATPETGKTPAVENPALARQVSSDLELLSAQANAQKNYEQPVVSSDSGVAHKPSLADLDLASGSFQSKEQNEQSISRILSTINDSTSSVKKNIRSQVLNRVVEHLQEEMGKEKLTIRLNPEKLGQVEIIFQTQGDQLNITMNSSGQEAQQAIQEGARELAESITEKSPRFNLVEIKVEGRAQDNQTKQDQREDERREKQNQGESQQQQGRRSAGDQNQETGAGEWAAFHLGG